MARSHPEQFDDHSVPRSSQWARNTVASLVLLASLVSLSIILHNQYGAGHAISFRQGVGALDLARMVPLPESQAAPIVADPNEGMFRAVGDYVARRYRVSSEMATDIVAKAHASGAALKLDPLLILAVISIESRFNPFAESGMGAKGLMQVIPRFHPDKFDPSGGEKVAFDPAANIMAGARILKEYIRRAGDVADGLQMYVGASDENENGYSAKVMAERDRLQFVLRQFQNQNRNPQPQAQVRPRAAAI